MATLALALLRPAVGHADPGCDLYASPAGSDSASGTATAPLRSVQRVADSLTVGQVGCFMVGTFSANDQIKVTRAGITLTSAPGTRATITGRWWIAEGADDVTISHLNLDGRNAAGKAGPSVHAVNTVFDDVDVTNQHTNTCFILGSTDYGAAVGTVIENSRIHDCGVLPSTNQDHGIYVEESEGVVIRDNWIYDNADRGVQLYPNAHGTHVYGNVIDGNGEGVTFSGEGSYASGDNLVEHNVISNSNVRWNVQAHWTDAVGSGNVLRENCLWSSSSESYYNQAGGVMPVSEGGEGFAVQNNAIAEPEFVDRAGANFALQPGSACEAVLNGLSPTQVTLETEQQVVGPDSPPLTLTGQVSAPGARTVTILKLRKGHWRKFARRRLRPNGTFVVRKKLRGVRGATRLRAVVPGARQSRAVKVIFKPTGGTASIGLASNASASS